MKIMIEYIIPLLGYISLAWVVANFQPLQNFLRMCEDYTRKKKINIFMEIAIQIAVKILTCITCVGLWLTLCITHNIYTAAIVSMLATIIDKKIGGTGTRLS